jgi:hypothetical protein
LTTNLLHDLAEASPDALIASGKSGQLSLAASSTCASAYNILSQASSHASCRSTGSSTITMSKLVHTLKQALLGENEGIKNELQTLLTSMTANKSDNSNDDTVDVNNDSIKKRL